MDLAPARRDADQPPPRPARARSGRVGVAARRGGRQHQLDDARPVRAARRRLHGPRARRRRARRRSSDAIRADEAVIDVWVVRLGGDAVTRRRRPVARPGTPLIPEGLDATLVLLRHGESEWIVEDRFQGQAETPLSATGPAPGGARRRAARRVRTPRRSCPCPHGLPLEIVHSPLAADRARRRGAVAEAIARRPATARRRSPPVRPEPGFLEIGQGEWEGVHQDEIARRWPEVLARVAPPAVGGVGAGRRVARRRSRRASGPALADDPRAPRPRLPARDARPPAGRRLRGRAAPRPDQPWSILVGHDGVFKVDDADAVRAPAQPLLDVHDGAHRDHRRRVPRRATGAPGARTSPSTSRRSSTRQAQRRGRAAGEVGRALARRPGRASRERRALARPAEQQPQQRDPEPARRVADRVEARAAEPQPGVRRLHLGARRRSGGRPSRPARARPAPWRTRRRSGWAAARSRTASPPWPSTATRASGRHLAARPAQPGGDRDRHDDDREQDREHDQQRAVGGAAAAGRRRGRRPASAAAAASGPGTRCRRRSGSARRRAAAVGPSAMTVGWPTPPRRVERDPAVAREVDLDPGVGVAVLDRLGRCPSASPGRKPWTSRVGIGVSGSRRAAGSPSSRRSGGSSRASSRAKHSTALGVAGEVA